MECANAPADHFVWFYEEQAHLVAKVADFAAEGLRSGEHVILIATRPHLEAIRAGLPRDAAASPQLEMFDADTALGGFYRDGAIDADAFDATIGATVRAAAATRPVRAFGEMVALLWADGAVREAIQLETLWAELREHTEFSLLCAYPSGVALELPANAVCALHSEVRLGAAGEPTTSLRIYPATLEAVREARRFIRTCLGEEHPGLEDALLVTSELTSNAVYHAKSPFAVAVTLLDGAIRVSVRDASPQPPRLLPMTSAAESGRGVATIAALSRRWGIDAHADGKSVWAELRA
jgi:anti-sigma regulatory factor (Ser/Thr protein kinase)